MHAKVNGEAGGGGDDAQRTRVGSCSRVACSIQTMLWCGERPDYITAPRINMQTLKERSVLRHAGGGNTHIHGRARRCLSAGLSL